MRGTLELATPKQIRRLLLARLIPISPQIIIIAIVTNAVVSFYIAMVLIWTLILVILSLSKTTIRSNNTLSKIIILNSSTHNRTIILKNITTPKTIIDLGIPNKITAILSRTMGTPSKGMGILSKTITLDTNNF